ncbi:MAG TPA: helix-turn-helix domain-containing protein [Trebonia sp.]|nr:helix-turn-helix domain-containing protein [Trebonia sp.]
MAPDAIYVEDGPIFSSAGVTAGTDLALALVERDHGAGLARDVELIRFDTAKDLLDAGHSVTDTALRSGYGSSETLRRAFIQHLGVSPRAYQQRFRSAIRD